MTNAGATTHDGTARGPLIWHRRYMTIRTIHAQQTVTRGQWRTVLCSSKNCDEVPVVHEFKGEDKGR